MRFPHSSSINTSLGEFSKFPISSISVPSSSCSARTTFFGKVAFFNETLICFENNTRKIKQVYICERSLVDFNAYIFVSSALGKRKPINGNKSNKLRYYCRPRLITRETKMNASSWHNNCWFEIFHLLIEIRKPLVLSLCKETAGRLIK